MKIKLNDILEYDDTKGIIDQSQDVKIFLLPFIDAMNITNCNKKDNKDRPSQWIINVGNVEITYDRNYSTDKKNEKKVSTSSVKLKVNSGNSSIKSVK